jgi:heptosyltransferase-2
MGGQGLDFIVDPQNALRARHGERRLPGLEVASNALAAPRGRSYIPLVPATGSGAPRILAVRFSSIGDIVLTTPLLRAIRGRHPEAHLSVLTKESNAPLLAGNPRINELIAWSQREGLASLAARLRAQRFTHLLDLHGSIRSRVLRLLVPGHWSGYGKRRLARAALIHWKQMWYAPEVPVAERYFEAAASLEVRPDGGPAELFVDEAADHQAGAWLAAAGLGARPVVAVAPGAAHFTKRWPLKHWQTLIRALVSEGFEIAVLGGPDDAELGRAVAAAGGDRVATAAGGFGLQQTAALLRRSVALVTGDTGVMHMATGVGTPVVALFGPTVRAFGFFPYRARAVVLERDLECRPCSSHGSARCPLGHHRCLTEITPDEVGQTLHQLLP